MDMRKRAFPGCSFERQNGIESLQKEEVKHGYAKRSGTHQ